MGEEKEKRKIIRRGKRHGKKKAMNGVKEAWAKLRGGEIKYGCKEGILHFVASNLIKTGT